MKYYWRVDEIDSNGIITIGNIWAFTTQQAGGGEEKEKARFVLSAVHLSGLTAKLLSYQQPVLVKISAE